MEVRSQLAVDGEADSADTPRPRYQPLVVVVAALAAGSQGRLIQESFRRLELRSGLRLL
jgi:hypothetical protein